MRLPLGLALLAAAVAMSGCALPDSRYDYSRLTGLGDYDESIIDWNFPTSINQGPLLPPERFRGYPPALGVPWATSDVFSLRRNQAPSAGEAARAEAAPHEPSQTCAKPCDAAAPVVQVDTSPRADARVREPSLSH